MLYPRFSNEGHEWHFSLYPKASFVDLGCLSCKAYTVFDFRLNPNS
jgi:hypothetical protein